MIGPVSVVCPWRDDHGPRRDLWGLVSLWWASRHPDWQIVRGVHDDGLWCKAAAVADGLTRADGNVIVVADADVLPPAEPLTVVAGLVADGSIPWGMPHKRVVRLTAAGTDHYRHTGLLPIRDPNPPPRQPPTGRELVQENQKAKIGGGCVVLTRDLYGRIPLDLRFRGWGQEDESWGRALTVITGPPWRPGDHLWHLWHPPQERLNRRAGSAESMALFRRYRSTVTAEAMLALLAEQGQASTVTA